MSMIVHIYTYTYIVRGKHVGTLSAVIECDAFNASCQFIICSIDCTVNELRIE